VVFPPLTCHLPQLTRLTQENPAVCQYICSVIAVTGFKTGDKTLFKSIPDGF
jgi:hypothetical protein